MVSNIFDTISTIDWPTIAPYLNSTLYCESWCNELCVMRIRGGFLVELQPRIGFLVLLMHVFMENRTVW